MTYIYSTCTRGIDDGLRPPCSIGLETPHCAVGEQFHLPSPTVKLHSHDRVSGDHSWICFAEASPGLYKLLPTHTGADMGIVFTGETLQ